MKKSIGQDLRRILPDECIKDNYIDLVSYGSDAGFYYLQPQAIVQPKSDEHIQLILKFGIENKIPVVFRAGGTSLSGQSITDGILVDISKFWNKISIENNGDQVRVQPGISGLMVNNHLKKYKRKIGPDPSSINAALMGGILSNNASGMCCGVVQNSYHTTKYISFILPNGNKYATENPNDYTLFEKEALAIEIIDIRNKILVNGELILKIRNKYKTKNTVGYSINAFLDFEKPLDIFAHLLIGGEGTLAFISEVVMNTVPDLEFKSTGLLFFADIFKACEAIIPLTNAGAAMVELMDRSSLRSVEKMEGMPETMKDLPENAAALLIEFQEDNESKLTARVNDFLDWTKTVELLELPEFSKDRYKQALLWKVRKGLFPAVGAIRKSGTSVILEDVAFPVEKLGTAVIDIQDLFKKHKYENGIIFGHAKDGNIHFVVTQHFNDSKEVARYEAFMEDVVNLVVHKHNGALKAEHGTGRNMAPFVETEWGKDGFEIMKRLKKAADPDNILNPGVIINHDKKTHIKNLKQLATVESEIDTCIECGFCEPKCPSKNFTSSPRRRIVTRRILQNLKLQGEKEKYNLLNSQFQFDGLDTCAVDGLCAVDCPVGINTGDLVKKLRVENHTKFEKYIAKAIVNYFATFQQIIRLALKVGFLINNVFGRKSMFTITSILRKLNPSIPLWTTEISKPPTLSFNSKFGKLTDKKLTVVYFPSCISRMMGSYAGKEKNIMDTFLSVSQKANIEVKIVSDTNKQCCGQIFSSKGFNDAFEIIANRTFETLWKDSINGALPIVIDVSSCAYTLHSIQSVLNSENKRNFSKLKILDTVDYLHEYVNPNIEAKRKKDKIVVHAVCSLQKLKTEEKFIQIAKKFSEEVVHPINSGCCGMAGDRGFLIPELTKSATNNESIELNDIIAESYYSTTKTCEMAMTAATGKNYESILYLIDECT